MMKLDATKVQEIRALLVNGFATRSIADAYGISHRQVWNISSARAWKFLPVVAVPLPILCTDQAARLRLRSAKRLSASQQRELEQYRARLAGAIDDSAAREGYAIALMNNWTPKRSRRKREVTPL